MSATENIALENAPQYVAIVNALAEKDLKIAELVKEIDKRHHIIRSARFGVKSERRDTVITPEGSTTCEDCGTEKERISQVVSEKLQVIPAQYFVERINKVVLSCGLNSGLS